MKCVPFRADSENKNTVIGNDADRIAVDMGKTTDQGGAIQGFELRKFTAVYDSGNDLAYVKRFARIRWDHTVNLVDCILRFKPLP